MRRVLQQNLRFKCNNKKILKIVQNFAEIKIRPKIKKNFLHKNSVTIQKEHEEILLRRPLWRPHDQVQELCQIFIYFIRLSQLNIRLSYDFSRKVPKIYNSTLH